MKMMICVLAIALLGCNGFIGEAKIGGPPIAIVDPDYVVLLDAATSARIIDLRQLDPRTAEVVEDNRILVNLTPEGSATFLAWTSSHVGQKLGIYVGGKLIATPVILSPISGTIILDGTFTKAEAEAIVARMKKGGAK